jgi:site-specific DNA-methyltransferase (adenine-specific)
MLAQASVQHLPLAENSIDLIFTDPPYPKEYLYTYEWLISEAVRVLKPDGFVIAMAGGYQLNKIFTIFEKSGLEYFYEFIHKVNGTAPYIWPRFVVAKSKSLLCYGKGKGLPRLKSVLSVFEPSAKSKSKQWHHWGQDVESARYYIDCFSKPGDLICDPFIGGGTTAVACELIGRRCISFDIDPAALRTTRSRLEGAEIYKQDSLFAVPANNAMQPTAFGGG